MNAKSLLIAAAVLATPACAVSEAEMTSASEAAVTARVSLLGETFLSRETFQIRQSRQRPDGQWVMDTITVRYRLRFIPTTAGDYGYDGQGAMEYETVIDQVQESMPELSFWQDRFYYAKRTSSDTFRLYDCDSSRRCTDDRDVSKLRTWTTDGKKSVAISGINSSVQPGDPTETGIYFEGVAADQIIFDLAPPAPSVTSLPASVTCTANGHTLKISPVSPASANRAEIELRDDRTNAIIDKDDYTVLRDSLGHYFIVGSYNGLRISLGQGAARYENEVTGKSVDFIPGTCR